MGVVGFIKNTHFFKLFFDYLHNNAMAASI